MFKSLVLLLSIFTYALTAQAETVFKVAYEDKVQFPYYMGDTTKVLRDKPGRPERIHLKTVCLSTFSFFERQTR